LGRELIGAAEGVGNGGGGDADDLGNVLQSAAGFQGRSHGVELARIIS
jgi:hypothetical protein